jgi:hypothetical protein
MKPEGNHDAPEVEGISWLALDWCLKSTSIYGIALNIPYLAPLESKSR